ncbi:aminotransferase class I/II-fold pyridoxal phosphate-dependent enzyme [Paraglaciecola arctica]|uniref:aminotransferase class I/II-fold pyridoxal phosphate-dependent enzyme n=1 Tax=Paraglaciecola arctica TaxID=1128911 RepID=UPI001C072C42|nr:aminotransferase class I/II-fold pyridoxal phosphate-dependent enzyme [Paraglaciecola arctica]MBU3003042.1 aminotransferase class I/II-fold pyridoxal phosphate-dependent enzyme [Paraglaciecola arctica]
MKKINVEQLALLGGKKIFEQAKSTSNLLKPNFEQFLAYSKIFYEQMWYSNNGPNVQLLEKRLAIFHNTKHCVTFSTGFWGLALATKVLALEGRTEIIMPSLTYRRMADMAAWTQLSPKFCEVDESTLAMTPETVAKCINKNTALILGVHPIVNCCDVEGLTELAKKHQIPILFDSVESVYESIESGKIGGFGNAECFSLHACKLINGFGGGYLTTNDDKLAAKLSSMRTFGFTNVDHVEYFDGLNAKLNEMHACMALASLDDIEQQVKLNQARYKCYLRCLDEVDGIELIRFDESKACGYKNIVARITKDWPFSIEDTISLLNSENILARQYYSPPLHLKEMQFDFVKTDLPLSKKLSNNHLNLPCGQKVDEKDIVQICNFLKFISSNSTEISNELTRNGGL